MIFQAKEKVVWNCWMFRSFGPLPQGRRLCIHVCLSVWVASFKSGHFVLSSFVIDVIRISYRLESSLLCTLGEPHGICPVGNKYLSGYFTITYLIDGPQTWLQHTPNQLSDKRCYVKQHWRKEVLKKERKTYFARHIKERYYFFLNKNKIKM